MRVLVAPDKFKGSLTAVEAAQWIADGWKAAWPECEISQHPVADGGDGTLEAVAAAAGGEWHSSPTHNAQGHPHEALWLYQPQTATAWIEIARICGLAQLSSKKLDPLNATTSGVGEVLQAAYNTGARRMFICLGGSATNDAGCGMAAALGVMFIDSTGTPFAPLPSALPRLTVIQTPSTLLPNSEIFALTDVRNPLLGPHGASHVYGPQKGASPDDVLQLEAALSHVVAIVKRDFGSANILAPGAGAAGGLGFGVLTFLDGQLRGGFEAIAELTLLANHVKTADLIITGEGRIDDQTSAGKAPAGVAQLARQYGKRVIAFAGSISPNAQSEFDSMIAIAEHSMPRVEAMRNAGHLLQAAAAQTAATMREKKTL